MELFIWLAIGTLASIPRSGPQLKCHLEIQVQAIVHCRLHSRQPGSTITDNFIAMVQYCIPWAGTLTTSLKWARDWITVIRGN